MAENSKIEWTTHTFNPWIGCAKVASGCANCYAEELMAKRYQRVVWGVNGTRVKTKTWRDPIRWNREAAESGERHRVFCASLADVFEDRPELEPWRAELFALIDATPHLDWLPLTKRPENIGRMWPKTLDVDFEVGSYTNVCEPRKNVWLGTSIATQADADRNVPLLRACRDLAPVLFLSCEPLIEAVTLDLTDIDWVIVGGESGHGARPMHPDWARSIREQCQSARVPFFFKQWGEWAPIRFDFDKANVNPNSANIKVIEHAGNRRLLKRVGKKSAGRILDGRTWDEFPATELSKQP